MRLTKKWIIIGVVCLVVVVGVILGGVAIANAANNDNASSANATQASLWDKVAQMYQQDTGTAIDPSALQKAYQEAGKALREDKIDQMLQNLVTQGKITQDQANTWKTWWDSRPTSALSDQFKTWLNSAPNIPGLPGGKNFGRMPFGKHMPFGGGGKFFGHNTQTTTPSTNS